MIRCLSTRKRMVDPVVGQGKDRASAAEGVSMEPVTLGKRMVEVWRRRAMELAGVEMVPPHEVGPPPLDPLRISALR